MPTLEEIAKIAGASRSTVSRVINNDPNVAEETRQRVQQVIRQFNFQPNRAARRLAGGRTRIIGLVIPTGISSVFSDPYFPNLIRGISSTCHESDYSVMLWLAEAEYERLTIDQVLHNGFVDGMIISSMPLDDSIVTSLIRSGLPFVSVGRSLTNPSINYVDVENRRGALEAVMHLIRQKRRRIATITGPLNTIAGVDRRDGYLEALRIRGIPADPALIVEGNFSEDEGYNAMKQLLSLHPDAVFAASDSMALGAMRALREAGIKIPDEIALVGFDDLPFAAHTQPPLTTIRQPIQRTGSLAAETLMDILEHPDEAYARHIILPVELIIRETCGAIHFVKT
ncbi:MAG: LacI family transcriptional regulator [Anaerolineales bacterium]|jgi:LacI family transcriptional regulator|nr:LacI family transcriptional regulator [Anaerolineales bacterium]